VSQDKKPSSDQSFVGRWSKRKLQSQSEQGAKDAQVTQDAQLTQAKAKATLSPTLSPTLPNTTAMSKMPMQTVSDGAADNVEQAMNNARLSDEPDEGRSESLAASRAADQLDTEDEPSLTDADMPDIQSLDASSDVSPFFNRGVSAALRKAALNHIFSLPVYNIRDGLNDYDEDYTVWEPLGDTVTCDMKFHQERRERQRLERERLETETETETVLSSNEAIAVEDDMTIAEQREYSESLTNGEALQRELQTRLPTQHPDQQVNQQTHDDSTKEPPQDRNTSEHA